LIRASRERTGSSTGGIAENLLQVDEQGVIQPWLAASVTRTDDTHWTIALRPNLTFQNGKPLDATAAVAALNRQVAKAKATRVYLEEGSVFTAVDDLHLTLTTPKPNAMVPAALASRDNAFQVYDVAAIEAAAGDSTKIVGQGAFTGPYAITAWTPENLETARYDGYWAGRPAPGQRHREGRRPTSRRASPASRAAKPTSRSTPPPTRSSPSTAAVTPPSSPPSRPSKPCSST
jgi:ABC-type transport system substrate-binding protein